MPSTTDTLWYRDRAFELLEHPLESCFAIDGAVRPPFERLSHHSRGYVANWEVQDGWLFLTGLSACWDNGEPATLQQVFPNVGDKVFAAWYSGAIRGYRSDISPLSPRGAVRAPDLVINVHCGRINTASIVHHTRAVQRIADAAVPAPV
ncbi:MAG TPA: hypothetical protein PKA20_08905 [Burkholderiaceae bacterium]|nr:hypothetical protein [Burkholderiaceae bacterium]